MSRVRTRRRRPLVPSARWGIVVLLLVAAAFGVGLHHAPTALAASDGADSVGPHALVFAAATDHGSMGAEGVVGDPCEACIGAEGAGLVAVCSLLLVAVLVLVRMQPGPEESTRMRPLGRADVSPVDPTRFRRLAPDLILLCVSRT